MLISKADGERYKKQVLSQLEYKSITLPYRRGSIVDSNGSILAVSEKVYNLVIDCKIIMGKEAYLEPTLTAIKTAFPELDMTVIRKYIQEHPTSSYYVPLKQLTYDRKADFNKLEVDKENENRKNIVGVWFEEEYKRSYPNGSVACDVIGFTTTDGKGQFGLEEYYNDILSGTTGREFGYLNNDSNLERTTKPAVDGYTLVSTIDLNIQNIVEKYLYEFNEQQKNVAREGNGANNVGCIIMDVDTGNVLAMASYPTFDLNTPYDLSAYYTEEEVSALKENDTFYDTLNGIWRNFCISDTYEPGSTFKPFTVAMGLEDGILKSTDTFQCNGVLTVGGHDIKCHNKYGDGIVSLKQAIATSCNVALMKMAAAIGPDYFTQGQNVFNFGLKTNVDLSGEARTVGLLYDENMGAADLATNSFGQNFNCTMIQMIAAYCSLVNGGYYYEPHVVSRIETNNGSIVQNIEPRVLKQTVSQSTSDLIIEYCNAVCEPTYTGNTGRTARPAGYAIGGKTGTAQTLPRGNGEYVVSFMGYAPANDPQIAIYVVVDRVNAIKQDDAKYATVIVRNILTEVLPYLNIYMTEELSETERKELEQRQIDIAAMYAPVVSEDDPNKENDTGENVDEGLDGGEQTPVWKTFEKNQDGYYVDPNTGDLLDPQTGDSIKANNVVIDFE